MECSVAPIDLGKVLHKVSTTFDEFKAGRAFASRAEAEKAWAVYHRASKSKGLIIGYTNEIITQAGQEGRDVLYFVMDKSAPYGGWT